jgi:DNA-binding CsgD family transcriptional regulator
VVFLVNVMFDILQTRAASAVILAIYAVLVGFDLLIAFTSFRGGSLFPLPFKEFSPEDILVYLSAAYPIVVTILYLKRIENPIVFKLMRAVLIFTLCILPFMVLDEFNISLTLSVGGSSPIMIRSLAFPFSYVVLNFILIYYGFKFYIREESAAAPSSISSEFVKAFRISDREMEVIRLIQEGYSNKEIGEKLFISPATVRNHLHNLFEKTSARNRVDLLRRARGPLAHG